MEVSEKKWHILHATCLHSQHCHVPADRKHLFYHWSCNRRQRAANHRGSLQCTSFFHALLLPGSFLLDVIVSTITLLPYSHGLVSNVKGQNDDHCLHSWLWCTFAHSGHHCCIHSWTSRVYFQTSMLAELVWIKGPAGICDSSSHYCSHKPCGFDCGSVQDVEERSWCCNSTRWETCSGGYCQMCGLFDSSLWSYMGIWNWNYGVTGIRCSCGVCTPQFTAGTTFIISIYSKITFCVCIQISAIH